MAHVARASSPAGSPGVPPGFSGGETPPEPAAETTALQLYIRKLILVLLFVVATAGGLSAAEPADEKEKAKEKAPEAAAQVERNEKGETVLTVPPETQQRIALKIAAVAAAEHSPEAAAYGSVLDPGPLITLQAQMATTDSSLSGAKLVAERARALFQQGENISRKTLEAAQGDLEALQIKQRAELRQLESDWGAAISKMDTTNRETFIAQLASRETALIEVDTAADERLGKVPAQARVSSLGEEHWQTAAVLSRASKADPKTQGEGFLLRLDGANPPFQPNASVKALLQLDAPAQKGVVIPRSSILYVDGKAWVYAAGLDNKFTRKEVKPGAPLEEGWFVADGFAPDTKLVVEGAQVLLSEEQKSQIKAD